jgi:hypothetical protein
MEDGFVLVPRPANEPELPETTCEYLPAIDRFIHNSEPSLWSLNSFIHDNPELGYNEHKAHDALTNFMQSREGWHVSRSAYGLQTAWVATFDSGRPGPVVSFNAEMGMMILHYSRNLFAHAH